MDYLDKARRVIALEMAEVQRLLDRLDDSFSRAVATILPCVENRGKIVVCGVGKSGHIGEKIAATLTSTGSPAVVLNSLNALHGDLGVVSDGDVVLALSYSGETDELVNILPAPRAFRREDRFDDGKSQVAPRAAEPRASRCERRAGGVSAESRADLLDDGAK